MAVRGKGARERAFLALRYAMCMRKRVLPEVNQDSLYQQFSPVVSKGYPYPNDFTDTSKEELYNQVCSAMKAQVPGYICGSTLASQ